MNAKFIGKNASHKELSEALKKLKIGAEYSIKRAVFSKYEKPYFRLWGVKGRFNTSMFEHPTWEEMGDLVFYKKKYGI